MFNKLFLLVFLTNISNIHAHNFINGGCKNHCEVTVKEIINKNKLRNDIDEEIDRNNSCLNKSLCRG